MSGYTADDSSTLVQRTVDGGSPPAVGDRVILAPHHQRPVPLAALRNLLDQVAWTLPRDDGAIAALLGAGPAVAAWDGEWLVGFVRALSDGHVVAYIEEAIVHPQYREHGLRTVLLTRLLAELAGVAVVNLCCDPSAAPFYATQGFAQLANVLVQRRQPEHTT
jgi:GNAT superfamily N-acetyltransferase